MRRMHDKTVFVLLEKDGLAYCPYFDGPSLCRASLSASVPTVRTRENSCTSDNHDSCPLFLAKALRRL